MARIDIPASGLSLTSSWKCTYELNPDNGFLSSQSTPTTARKTVRFKLNSLPAGAVISSARVHSIWKGSMTGYRIATINGKQPNTNDMVIIDNPAAGASYVDVEFAFSAYTDNASNHWTELQYDQTYTANHTTTANVSEIYLRIYYDIEYTECTAPTSVTVSPSSAAPGAKLTLEWSGAGAGNVNAITGYEVYRAASEDGDYTLLSTVSSTSTAGNTTVAAPTENGATYYYKVKTLGTQSGYDSDLSEAVASLACDYAATSAPTTLRVASTNAGPGVAVTLEWTGASPGTNNPIAGYEVHRADDPSGAYTLLATVTTAETNGSAQVATPTENGVTYYYRVKTLGTVGGTDSGLSTVYTALTCTYSSPNAPTTVAANGAQNLYVRPGSEITLEWTGATDGANNPITGFVIWQSDEVLAEGIAPDVTSYTFTTPEDGGVAHTYTVVAQGPYSSSPDSPPVNVYIYTDPAAPTAVSVSDATPVAGGRVKLYWSGAEPGAFNDIEAYAIYRSTTVNGEGARIATVASTATSGTYYVDAPARAGTHYYYRVETVGKRSSSRLSTAYADLTSQEDTGSTGAEITVKITPPPPRKKRGFLFGEYDTVLDGKWTLAEWSFPEPEPETNYIVVPGRNKGPLDMTAVNTGGDPRYGSRTLTARFESSEGTRLERESRISRMVNRLHGSREEIVLPDDGTRYALGRISIRKEYNDMAHASVTVTATCDPWRYSKRETMLELAANDTIRTALLANNGRMQVVPEITVTGYNAWVQITVGSSTWTLDAGTYLLPGFVLRQGYTEMTYTGSGTIAVRYREAIL